MKSIYLAVLLASLCLANAASVEELFTKMQERKDPVGESLQYIIESLKRGDSNENKAYEVARTGIGCSAGAFGLLNTIFTDIDVIASDYMNWEVYLFAVLYVIAWYQQNGQFMVYMCETFWQLIHTE